MRGPGTKLQQGQDKARGRKTLVPGICDEQTERRARVSEDSLGWREGPKARDSRARNRQRQRGLVGAKGLKPWRQGQGTHAVNSLGWREASGQFGLGRGPRKQGRRGPDTKLVCGQLGQDGF